jgi:hypothetical protein
VRNGVTSQTRDAGEGVKGRSRLAGARSAALEALSRHPASWSSRASLDLGSKTVTCWAASEPTFTEVGKLMVMLDGSGNPRAVLETVELTQARFNEVDEQFAFDEGEGDRTLSYGGMPTEDTSHAGARSLRICSLVVRALPGCRDNSGEPAVAVALRTSLMLTSA